MQGKSAADAPAILKEIGITSKGVTEIYEKYGNTVQARTVLAMLGTSPEKLKQQTEQIMGGNTTESQTNARQSFTAANSAAPKKFPRLK